MQHSFQKAQVITILRTKSVALLVATTLLAPSFVIAGEASAFAQPAKKKTLREQLPPEAQKHWDAALALYQSGQWDGARTSTVTGGARPASL